MGAGQLLELTLNPNTKFIPEVTIPAFLEIPDANLTVHGR